MPLAPSLDTIGIIARSAADIICGSYVGQLRHKIEAKPDDLQIVITEPGIGYRVAEPG